MLEDEQVKRTKMPKWLAAEFQKDLENCRAH